MIWYSVDPGVEYVAFAKWRAARLECVDIIPVFEPPDGGKWTPRRTSWQMQRFSGALVVCEGQFSANRYADIIGLSRTTGILVGMALESVVVAPYDWKGTVPKETTMLRILDGLSSSERAHLMRWADVNGYLKSDGTLKSRHKTSPINDVLAAIGIGKVYNQHHG